MNVRWSRVSDQKSIELFDSRKEIHFVTRLSPQTRAGHYVLLSEESIDYELSDRSSLHRIDMNAVYRSAETEWKRSFINALGNLNQHHASVEWWALTATAKNLLSSTFGNKVFGVLALCKVVEETEFDRLFVVGADATQIEIFKTWLDQKGLVHSITADTTVRLVWLLPIESLLRNLYHILRVFRFFYLRQNPNSGPDGPIDVCLFTYMDENIKNGEDSFFGRLTDLIRVRRSELKLQITGFVHSRYSRVLPRLRTVIADQYYPIYYELRLHDFWWAFWKTVRVRIRDFINIPNVMMVGLDLKLLLFDAFKRDVTEGRYLHNLLVYRSAFRFSSRYKPTTVIYPYENKSLEKLLLIGVRMGYDACKLVGYQHTSITPRHTTLLFAEDEASKTPLPDTILTVGDVTRDYLEKYGNYPPGIFATAGALRQVKRDRADYNPIRNRPMRILLALSSSRIELLEAISFMRQLKRYAGSCELGIRPHPEFPLAILPNGVHDWVKENARDYSGTALASNIDWCDVVAYVSSTVALEALMAGRPVINFQIGDPINPDPVLGDAPFCWRVNTPDQFQDTLRKIQSMSNDEYGRESVRAREYALSYLKPFSSECIERFYAFC